MAAGERRDEAVVWVDRDLGGLEVLRASYRTHVFAPHAHETFAIGLMEEGAGGFVARGGRHVASDRAFFIFHPGEVHDGFAATPDGWAYRMLYPPPDLMREIMAEAAGRAAGTPSFPTSIIRDEALAGLARRLHLRLEQPADRLARETALRQVLTALVARHARPGLPGPPPARDAGVAGVVRDYLHAHFADEVSLQQLAAVAHRHPGYLIRAFRRATGLPPHAYLVQLRVREAKHLLRAGLPPAEVALLVGFADQSHLTRHFRRSVGVTPARYARGEREVRS